MSDEIAIEGAEKVLHGTPEWEAMMAQTRAAMNAAKRVATPGAGPTGPLSLVLTVAMEIHGNESADPFNEGLFAVAVALANFLNSSEPPLTGPQVGMLLGRMTKSTVQMMIQMGAKLEIVNLTLPEEDEGEPETMQ